MTRINGAGPSIKGSSPESGRRRTNRRPGWRSRRRRPGPRSSRCRTWAWPAVGRWTAVGNRKSWPAASRRTPAPRPPMPEPRETRPLGAGRARNMPPSPEMASVRSRLPAAAITARNELRQRTKMSQVLQGQWENLGNHFEQLWDFVISARRPSFN